MKKQSIFSFLITAFYLFGFISAESSYTQFTASRYNFIQNEPLPYIYAWPILPISDVQQFVRPVNVLNFKNNSALLLAHHQLQTSENVYNLFIFSNVSQSVQLVTEVNFTRGTRFLQTLDLNSDYNLIAFLPEQQILALKCQGTAQGYQCVLKNQSQFLNCKSIQGIALDSNKAIAYIATDIGLASVDINSLEYQLLDKFANISILSVAFSDKLQILAVGTLLKFYLYSTKLNLWRFEYTRSYVDIPYALAFREFDSTLWLASDEAVNVIQFQDEQEANQIFFDVWRVSGFQQGLPIGNLSMAQCTPDGVVQIAGKYGLIRFEGTLEEILPLTGDIKKKWQGVGQLASTTSPFRYFYEQRWMPSGEVIAMLSIPELSFTILSTPYGLSTIIANENYTLAQKTELFQQIMEQRHIIYGYATTVYLQNPAYVESGYTNSIYDDNLGLWTNMYLASQCLRYKVTGAQDALQQAQEIFQGVNRLYKVIPPVNYGLMAKTAVPNATLPDDPLWHKSTNPGYTDWIYKAGTSSDDVTSYFYALPLYIEFVAQTAADRQQALTMLIDTIDYIMENNWYLINVDGRSTRWGFWNPQRLNENAKYYSERLSNSIEIMAYLAVAYNYTHDEKYVDAMYNLGVQNQYLENIVNSRSNCPEDENFSDDELNYLALMAFFFVQDSVPPLFKEYFVQNMKHTWAQVQKYQPSLWTYMSYVALHDDVEVQKVFNAEHFAAAQLQLQQWGDLIEYHVDNSHRQDTVLNTNPRRLDSKTPQTVDLIRLDENGGARQWNSNPYELSQGNDARSEANPTWFLLPYWYKRYAEDILNSQTSFYL